MKELLINLNHLLLLNVRRSQAGIYSCQAHNHLTGNIMIRKTLRPRSVPMTRGNHQGCGSAIRIHLNRIQHFRLNTDPDPIRMQGFDDQQLGKIYSWKKIKFFLIKNYNLPIPRPPLRTSRYRRSLQLSKENIQSKHEISEFFFYFCEYSAPMDPDPDSESGSGSTGPIESGSNSDGTVRSIRLLLLGASVFSPRPYNLTLLPADEQQKPRYGTYCGYN